MADQKSVSLLTPKDLADLVGVSLETIRNWRLNGLGPPCVQIGRSVIRYRPEDVEAWLAEKAQAAS